LTPGASITVQIGAAGAAEAVQSNGTAGGDTFFNRTGGSANTCADTKAGRKEGCGANVVALAVIFSRPGAATPSNSDPRPPPPGLRHHG